MQLASLYYECLLHGLQHSNSPEKCLTFHLFAYTKIIHVRQRVKCRLTRSGEPGGQYYGTSRPIHPSIHLWRYSPFRALASLIRRFHSSLFATLLLHPLIPSSCSASLWTTSAHLVLGLPTGLVVWKFLFRTFFGILSFFIRIIWPAHSSLLSFNVLHNVWLIV